MEMTPCLPFEIKGIGQKSPEQEMWFLTSFYSLIKGLMSKGQCSLELGSNVMQVIGQGSRSPGQKKKLFQVSFDHLTDNLWGQVPHGSSSKVTWVKVKGRPWMSRSPGQKCDFKSHLTVLQVKWLVQTERKKNLYAQNFFICKIMKKLILDFWKRILVDSTLSEHLNHHECNNIGTCKRDGSMSIHDEKSWKVYGCSCHSVQIEGWVDGPKPIKIVRI